MFIGSYAARGIEYVVDDYGVSHLLPIFIAESVQTCSSIHNEKVVLENNGDLLRAIGMLRQMSGQ
jgi:hypothetical protein